MALKQVMEKQNRLEYLRDLNAQPPKHHEVTCSVYGTKGHNKHAHLHIHVGTQDYWAVATDD